MAYDCPNERTQPGRGRGGHGGRGGRGVSLAQFGVTFNLNDLTIILNDNWILLDTASTGNIYNNLGLLKELSKCNEDELLVLASNGNGHMEADNIVQCRYLCLEVHYNMNYLDNIISMSDLLNFPGVCIVFDSVADYGITVHM